MSQLERINIYLLCHLTFAKAWLLLFPTFLVYHSIRSEEYLPGPEAGTSIFSLSPRQRCDIKRVDFFPNRRRRRDLRLCHKPPMNSTATRSEALRWKTVSTFISTDWISLKRRRWQTTAMPPLKNLKLMTTTMDLFPCIVWCVNDLISVFQAKQRVLLIAKMEGGKILVALRAYVVLPSLPTGVDINPPLFIVFGRTVV